jgi:hypothetical protein
MEHFNIKYIYINKVFKENIYYFLTYLKRDALHNEGKIFKFSKNSQKNLHYT